MALNVQLQTKGFGSYLVGILPQDIAIACGALSATLMQVKNIQEIPVEKFAQVVANMESIKGLPINGTAVPTDTTLADSVLTTVGQGNGPYMTYTMSNFLGAMSGLPYNADLKTIQDLIQQLQTPELISIYNQLEQAVTLNQGDTVIQGYIDAANAELLNIKNKNPEDASKLNDAYDNVGLQLLFEQRARTVGLDHLPPQYPDAQADPDYTTSPEAQFSFLDSLYSYGQNIQPHMYAQTLEGIANLQNTGGQSLVGLMRESRNQSRLTELGISLDNTIPDTLSRSEQSILLSTGRLPIDDTTMTPTATLLNIDASGAIVGPIAMPLQENIGQVVPGALSKSPWSLVIPPDLNVNYASRTLLSSVYSVNEAIDEVIRCNCDCWDNL
jgi:hypothetical protein